MTEPDTAAPRPVIRPWTLVFLALFLMFGAWSLAAPYDGTPDEMEHLLRAAGVAAGELTPPPAETATGAGAVAVQTVPDGLVRQNCWRFKRERSAACARPPSADRTPVKAVTAAGRYHPAYYALVGWPLRLWPGWSGVLVARLISAAVSAALVACALLVTVRRSRHRLMVAGLLAATTPMAAQLAGAVNPNGLEIAAGIAFFAAAIPLILDRVATRRRGLVWLAGVSAVVLATLRSTGPLWFVIAFLALAAPSRRTELRELWRRRETRWWGLVVAVALLASVGWIVATQVLPKGTYSGQWLYRSQAALIEADRWRAYLDQIVGVTSWLDARMPAPPYLVWQFAAASLIVFALALGGWRDRARLLVLLVGAVVLPSALQVWNIRETGFVTQGRYMLPLLVGLPLLAAHILEGRALGAEQARALTRLFVVLLLPIHLGCLAFTMVRWQRGLPRSPQLSWLNPLVGDWHPVVGSLVPLAAETAGAVILGVLVWRAVSRRARSEPPAD
jgi:hypothetical protein